MSDPEDDVEIELEARQRELAAGYRAAARRALDFARLYRAEEGASDGVRERAAVAQANAWRKAAREARACVPVSAAPASARPGVARARPGAVPDSGRKTG